MNSGSPIMGRLARAGLGFLSSTAGFPVERSIGSLSQTTTPQIPPLHLLTRTLASPACVSQIPFASLSSCACTAGAARNPIKIAIIKPNLQVISLSRKAGLHIQEIKFLQCYIREAGSRECPLHA
jgi:hypothetical protein